jgi:predicted DNA-binding transcriptional regulator AlpA
MTNSRPQSGLLIIPPTTAPTEQEDAVDALPGAAVPDLPGNPELGGLKKRPQNDPLLSVEEVAQRLNVSRDWVWDHSSRKTPYLPVIRMGDGTLRYRASKIEEFIDERERLSNLRRKSR